VATAVATTSWSTGKRTGGEVRQGPEETGEGGRWSSLREGSSNGGGLDSRWGGDDVGGQSGQEARRREGGSVALEEGRGWGRE
jgi:hypothetical protein